MAKTKPETAEQADTKAETVGKTDTLVRMTKDGQTIAVHPSCVSGHKSVGWAVV